ncbi:TetR/AcrR family transcriptional regulator [Niallia endozanthoxylica]|uniref:TetR/AcrR family transcriptional regulator n=1 Tax=Niallia endozanthoxylica TaxID=2036016 RepID=A0A5J5H8R9_9BACI|nr:TetR/AcrR family transcriptional regulator [Niallia endozanthoxylica]KAA9017001.1 TetR/AcrR family transcriptional regulator [Niallia endozanthoxylica]
MSRKKIQMNRMWKYFVDATAQIIEEEGVENVTIRKIADIAGYTSSTIYNYFEELSHLIFFASMRYLNEYIKELSFYMTTGKNTIEKYILSWECFCKHSFNNPQIYNAIFNADLGSKPEELLARYFEVYQDDLTGLSEEVKPLIFEHNITKRSKAVLQKAVEEGYLDNEESEDIVNMTILIWRGMLTTFLNNRRDCNPEDAAAETMRYVRKITMSALKKPLELS